jgi:hypothetical protein
MSRQLGRELWTSLIEITLGLALFWPAPRPLARTLVESMLLTLTGTGPVQFRPLCTGMVSAIRLACLPPGRRATKADPMRALCASEGDQSAKAPGSFRNELRSATS